MNNKNNEKSIITDINIDIYKNIRKRILYLEKRNYTQKEYSNSEMHEKIKKIIEGEMQ